MRDERAAATDRRDVHDSNQPPWSHGREQQGSGNTCAGMLPILAEFVHSGAD
jgi:hypothetical protein